MKYCKTQIGDLVTLRQGFAINKKTNHHMSEEPTQLHLLRIGDMKDGNFSIFVRDTIPEKFVAKENDIIYTRTGQVGLVFRNQYGVVHNNCFTVTSNDENVLSQQYLYYALQEESFYEEANSRATGAAQPDLPHGAFNSIEIFLPPIEAQRKITNILDSYNSLIDNNQKQIKLLEEAAQRLYKEWFVNLRFPGYENVKIIDGVPEGWANCTLSDVIDFNPKVVFSKGKFKQCVPMSALSTSSMTINSSEFTLTTSTSGSKFQNGDTLLARITPCLENGKIGFVNNIESSEGAIGSTEFIVMRSKKLTPYMVYLLSRTNNFRKAAINSMTGSDGRQRVQVDKIKAYPYKLPSENILHGFSEIVKPIFSAVSICCKQCEKLSEARDRLLPKLMSGEIEL